MERGWTQADLAKLSGLGRSFISQIERGHFSVTLETIGALCTALGIAPATLIQSVEQKAVRAMPRP
jgi:transcriptional regulator with XRE-family HTH domain